jgi:hypothetical protein
VVQPLPFTSALQAGEVHVEVEGGDKEDGYAMDNAEGREAGVDVPQDAAQAAAVAGKTGDVETGRGTQMCGCSTGL